MSTAPASTVMREAAQWLVRLDDDADADTQAAFTAWLAADPAHVDAVRRLQGSLAALHELPKAPTRAALNSITRPRSARGGLKALAVALALLLPLGLVLQQYPPSYLMADIRTGTGQWSTQKLPDGSRISLGGHSAVDLHFDEQSRTLRLISGEILLDVAKDASRPFRVVTAYGSIRALGTRFVVEQLDGATRLAMIESSTEVKSVGTTLTVIAGQQVRFDASGVHALEAIDGLGLEQAWTAHQLIIKEQPLSQVLERLSRNHRGYLMFDAKALAGLKVTAVLPADDSERALRLLARSLPIKVDAYSPWLTRITLK